MPTSLDDTHAANQKLLSENLQFKKFEQRIQGWVMDSPLASAQFAGFFLDGGNIDATPTELLASYRERSHGANTPAIHVNPAYYPLVNFERKDTIVMEKALFAMLAHEIGHHEINSRTHPFTGKTTEENVQYRAEHEAMAILNAFKIFDEIRKNDSAFVPDFGSVGYLSNFNAGQAYGLWHQHRDERAAIEYIAEAVKNAQDTRTTKGLDNVPDYNHDDYHSHGERFRRDWEESERRRHNSPAINRDGTDHTKHAPHAPSTYIQPPPPGASPRELFEHMYAAMETGDDKVFKQAIATVADSPSNREFWAHISASVDADQREAQLQTQMQEQAQQLQRMERQGPVMSLGFSR